MKLRQKKNPPRNKPLPGAIVVNNPAVFHKLRQLFLLLIFLILLLLLLISRGVFDPPLHGTPQDIPLPVEFILPDSGQGSLRQVAFSQERPVTEFSIKGDVRWLDGERDILTGIALQDATNQELSVRLSPLGELEITGEGGSAEQIDFPRQYWPHVRTGNAVNEIWINVQPQETAVRINGEAAWRGRALAPPITLYLVGESYGGSAVVNFPKLSIFGLDGP